ncbi:SAM-dependent methyltransferase [Prauserella oleivorans]
MGRRARAAETARPDARIHDPYAEQLVKAADLPTRILDALGEDGAHTEVLRHYLTVRTRFFDDFFLHATERGTPQAVLLGSGLDTRPYRLAMPARTWELDQPTVIGFKNSVLAAASAEARSDHTALGIDLRRDWPDALVRAGFSPRCPTAWLAEGLLPYLPADSQRHLLTAVDDLSGPGSAACVEVFTRPTADSLDDPRLDRLRKELGISLTVDDLFYDEPGIDCAAWFRAHGWTVSEANPAEVATDLDLTLPEEGGLFDRPAFVTATKD